MIARLLAQVGYDHDGHILLVTMRTPTMAVVELSDAAGHVVLRSAPETPVFAYQFINVPDPAVARLVLTIYGRGSDASRAVLSFNKETHTTTVKELKD